MSTIENNKLIAVFMGGELTKAPTGEYITLIQDSFWVDQLKYHSSWDWLMPVVDKIESIHFDIYTGFSVIIKRNFIQILSYYKNMQDGLIYQKLTDNSISKIESTYEAVVYFINLHNQNNLHQ